MRKIHINPSFWIILAILIFLDMGRQYSLLLSAALIHELGHGLIILLYGNTIETVRLIPGGIDIQYKEYHFSYGADILIALAGPLANLLTAILFSVLQRGEADYFIGLNLLLCFFNLLPLHPLDGGKILCAIVNCFFPMTGDLYFFLFSALLSFLFFVASLGACFYNWRALWSAMVFGYILCLQNFRWFCKGEI